MSAGREVFLLALGTGILLTTVAGAGLGVSTALGFKDGYREGKPTDDATMHRKQNVAAGYVATTGLAVGAKLGLHAVQKFSAIRTGGQASAVFTGTTFLSGAAGYAAARALTPTYNDGFKRGVKYAEAESKGRS